MISVINVDTNAEVFSLHYCSSVAKAHSRVGLVKTFIVRVSVCE